MKKVRALLVAAAFGLLASPATAAIRAGAADVIACTTQALTDNHLTERAARRLPIGAKVALAGETFSLNRGENIWSLCEAQIRMKPLLDKASSTATAAQAEASRLAAENASLAAKGAAPAQTVYVPAPATAVSPLALALIILFGALAVGAGVLAFHFSRRLPVPLRAAREPERTSAPIGNAVVESLPRLHEKFNVVLEAEDARGERIEIPVTIVRYELHTLEGRPVIEIKARAPWHKNEHEAITVARLDLETGALTTLKNGLVHQLAASEGGAWLNTRKPGHAPVKETEWRKARIRLARGNGGNGYAHA